MNAPLIRTCSLLGPSVTQTLAPVIVLGTRFTGTVTVLASPHPASRSPWVMTWVPDSAFTVTLGPALAVRERRIALVPAGSVPTGWHTVVPPETDVRTRSGATEFVPARVGREPDSTRPTATAVIASPTVRATRTLRIIRAAVRGSCSGGRVHRVMLLAVTQACAPRSKVSHQTGWATLTSIRPARALDATRDNRAKVLAPLRRSPAVLNAVR